MDGKRHIHSPLKGGQLDMAFPITLAHAKEPEELKIDKQKRQF
jgi:hypothetical protein